MTVNELLSRIDGAQTPEELTECCDAVQREEFARATPGVSNGFARCSMLGFQAAILERRAALGEEADDA